MLGNCSVIGFIPTTDFDAAKRFYEGTLGLKLLRDDGVALVFDVGGNMLRVVHNESLEVQPFTILGWEVDDIADAVRRLAERGVEFKTYPYFDQDALGVWTAPSGDRVAWFSDPEGNVLSLSQHVTRTP